MKALTALKVKLGASRHEDDRALLWVGCCALTLGISAAGAWLFWFGIALALPLVLIGLGYAGVATAKWAPWRRDRGGVAPALAQDLPPHSATAAYFATIVQVLRFTAAVALLLNLVLIVILLAVAAANSGYVGENYELSETYLTSSEAAIRAFGSLALLSATALLGAYLFSQRAELRAGERAALQLNVGAVRTIKIARALDTTTIITFAVATLVGIVALVPTSATG